MNICNDEPKALELLRQLCPHAKVCYINLDHPQKPSSRRNVEPTGTRGSVQFEFEPTSAINKGQGGGRQQIWESLGFMSNLST